MPHASNAGPYLIIININTRSAIGRFNVRFSFDWHGEKCASPQNTHKIDCRDVEFIWFSNNLALNNLISFFLYLGHDSNRSPGHDPKTVRGPNKVLHQSAVWPLQQIGHLFYRNCQLKLLKNTTKIASVFFFCRNLIPNFVIKIFLRTYFI